MRPSMRATGGACGWYGASYRGAYGLNERLTLHTHFILDPSQRLECSSCKNSSGPPLCTGTDCSTRTSTTEVVRE